MWMCVCVGDCVRTWDPVIRFADHFPRVLLRTYTPPPFSRFFDAISIRRGINCAPCLPAAANVVLAVGDAVFFSTLVVAAFVLSDAHLTLFIYILSSLQMIRVVGKRNEALLPGVLRFGTFAPRGRLLRGGLVCVSGVRRCGRLGACAPQSVCGAVCWFV